MRQYDDKEEFDYWHWKLLDNLFQTLSTTYINVGVLHFQFTLRPCR